MSLSNRASGVSVMINAVTGQVKSDPNHMSGNPTYHELKQFANRLPAVSALSESNRDLATC